MELIDTHSHLYLDDFKNDIDEVMERCRQNGVNKILLPNIDSTTHNDLGKLCRQYPANCFPMMGLHPCSIKENYQEELALVESELSTGKYIAVGEIGLDFYWDLTYKDQQIEAFKKQVGFAKKFDLPIAIHSRKSFDEIINLLESLEDDSMRGVFHCFTGSVEDAQVAISLGFYLGIGGVLTFKNSGLDKTIKEIDTEHLILETDSPYLAPVPFRGKRNESSYVKNVAEKLAEIKSTSLGAVAEQTTLNAKKLFGKLSEC